MVLPELAPCGYVFRSREEVLAVAQPYDGELLAQWRRQAAAGEAVVIGGFCERAPDGRIFNSVALIDGDHAPVVYRKLHLWDDEQRWFAPGLDSAPVISTRYGRIGLGICYDIEFPELTRGLALAGADLIVLPANWPSEEATLPAAHRPAPMLQLLALTTAYLSRVFVVACDRGGGERGLRFQGGSVIAAPDGTALAVAAPGAGEHTLIADCNLELARDKRSGPRNDAFVDRRPEHYPSALADSVHT